jgi:hypothetical protein
MADSLASIKRILRELKEQLPEHAEVVDFDLAFGRELRTPIEPHDQILDMRQGRALAVPAPAGSERLRDTPRPPPPPKPRKRGWKRPDKIRPPLDQERALLFGGPR